MTRVTTGWLARHTPQGPGGRQAALIDIARSHRKPTDKTALSGTPGHGCYDETYGPDKLFVQVVGLTAIAVT